MSKHSIDWFVIKIERHSVIDTGDIRQMLHGSQRHAKTVYERQLPDIDITELVQVAESLHLISGTGKQKG